MTPEYHLMTIHTAITNTETIEMHGFSVHLLDDDDRIRHVLPTDDMDQVVRFAEDYLNGDIPLNLILYRASECGFFGPKENA